MKKIALIMGSDSDLSVCQKAIDFLNDFEIPYECKIISAHRTPELVREFATKAFFNQIGVIIAAAGCAAHLAGAIASYTTLPVIALPINSSCLNGLDSLLSSIQMPKGVPVACVSIDGAQNAAILAVQILGINDELITQKLIDLKIKDAKKILDKNLNFN
ncbi:MAG: 5-(carboxyamino)imidazole ribonucleotide mutase [Clostridiales bacterium]|jgi:5-(carboxyamino)imidazole ribonucleotide mutase|nr:5-(carboxyamino)imidazole ribonucleotide mutase [Clostridiales bacterium]